MSRQKGNLAELKAVEYLKEKNFDIIETNYYARKFGEIDIIALKNDVYHFCEVKSAKDYETAILNITNSKLTKIKKSLEYYLKVKNIDKPFCIDAIIISENDIDFLENISF